MHLSETRGEAPRVNKQRQQKYRWYKRRGTACTCIKGTLSAKTTNKDNKNIVGTRGEAPRVNKQRQQKYRWSKIFSVYNPIFIGSKNPGLHVQSELSAVAAP
jgi:hypothetical protein